MLIHKNTRFVGAVIDQLYGVDTDNEPFVVEMLRHNYNYSNRIYSDEHMMCFGVPAFGRAIYCLNKYPAWLRVVSSKQWLKLV